VSVAELSDEYVRLAAKFEAYEERRAPGDVTNASRGLARAGECFSMEQLDAIRKYRMSKQ
jgi:hypothetical protein